MLLLKVCDIRDPSTALACAELGVTHVGLHCIDGLKPNRRADLLEVARKLKERYPGVETVLVTRMTAISTLAEVIAYLGTSCAQLHSPDWTPDAIEALRKVVEAKGGARLRVIGVGTPAHTEEWFRTICPAVDMVIIDQSYWGEPRTTHPLPASDYVRPVACVRNAGKPALIAGGLDPHNVIAYLRECNPNGVDVQRGVRTAGAVDLQLVRRMVEILGREFV